MTSKKFLSDKKTSKQTISISPALKEWVERHVNVNHQKHPGDDRFKSISAFYNYVMEKSMESFAKGKSLEDFENFVDGAFIEFQNPFSFSATIPIYEPAIKLNRYTNLDIDNTIKFLLAMRRLAYSSGFDPNDLDTVRNFIDRTKNYFFSNKLTKLYEYEIIENKNNKKPIKFIFEFAGFYHNISFENFKLNIAILSIFGLKLSNLIYSPDENYCKMELKPTYLYFSKEIAKKARLKLIEDNMIYLINYDRITKDKDYYLWMKMAIDKDISISFKNEKVKRKWITLIIGEIRNYGEREDFLLNLLKLFKILHWIDIENEYELSFKITLSKIKNKDEREYLLNFLSEYSQVSEDEGKYYLR